MTEGSSKEGKTPANITEEKRSPAIVAGGGSKKGKSQGNGGDSVSSIPSQGSRLLFNANGIQIVVVLFVYKIMKKVCTCVVHM